MNKGCVYTYPSNNGRTDSITKEMGYEDLYGFGSGSPCWNNGVLFGRGCMSEGVGGKLIVYLDMG